MTVEVRHADHPYDDVVIVGGREQVVEHLSLLRDGGTRIYTCDGGTLTLPRRLNNPDRTPRWEAKP